MKKVLIFFSIFIFLIISSILILAFPKFEISNTIGYVNKKYNPQINVYNTFKNLNNKVNIDNKVDINKIGKYSINLKYKYLFFDINKTFYVDIIDKTKPLITLLGNETSTVCPNHEYQEEGYSAIDNYDGDITDKVQIERTANSIFYSVLDSSNNSFQIERKIVYQDLEKPNIVLNGNSTISIYQGNSYNEPGYSASDNCGGDITNKVIVTNNVNTFVVGTYKIKYEVTDSNNNTASIERVVNVKKKIVPIGNGKIYLTFDDGGSYLTNQILDILNRENVKATFFVVKANDTTKRAYNEGHAIGLHSNTHNYSYIYANSDNYFNDLNAISNSVYNLLGFYSKIIRFPGGSSNTVSRKYQKGIMSYLTEEVKNRGYTYFDWNIDSNDAGSDIRNSTNIYYNVVNNLSHNKTNVVLMHDSAGHEATVSALENIIDYGKNNGYTFEIITESTPVVVHSVNN